MKEARRCREPAAVILQIDTVNKGVQNRTGMIYLMTVEIIHWIRVSSHDAVCIQLRFPESGAPIFLPGELNIRYRFVIFQGYLAVCQILFKEIHTARAVHEKEDEMRILFPWIRRHSDTDDDE